MTRLPGRINAYWTGMLVRNPDGSRFFTNGVQPDILIQRTLADYVEGKDPELNKALEILNANL
jgi:C-terminal processing protease CtpA/Prc